MTCSRGRKVVEDWMRISESASWFNELLGCQKKGMASGEIPTISMGA